MLIYYIDDSFLQSSAFSKQMLQKLQLLMQKEHPQLVLISAYPTTNPRLDAFIQAHQDETTLLTSPRIFDIEGIRGNLQNAWLLLEGFAMKRCCSGSFLTFDTQTRQCTRRYLELFPDQASADTDDLIERIEAILLEHFGKNRTLH